MKVHPILASLIIGSNAFGTIVEDQNVTLSTNEWYNLNVYQNVEGTDGTCTSFKFLGCTLIDQISSCADESSEWYYANYGEYFDGNGISNQQFIQISGLCGSPTNLGLPLGNFYLGVNTGYGIFGPCLVGRDVYGWAHFVNDGISIKLLGSAVAYGEAGITVGFPESQPTEPIVIATNVQIDSISLISNVYVSAFTYADYAKVVASMPPCSEKAVYLEFMSWTNQSNWERAPGGGIQWPTNTTYMEMGRRKKFPSEPTNRTSFYNPWMTFRLSE